MFHDIPEPVAARMDELHQLNVRQRADGMPRLQRLRQIPPEIGRFIALLAATAPPGEFIEIGTSGGYSTLWLALACRELGRTITTYEISEAKVAVAGETFAAAGVEDVVTLVQGDALEQLEALDGIAFCFLDAEKEDYLAHYEAVVPRLVPGGLLVADNAVDFEEALRPMLDRALADARVDTLVVPFATGELICRKRESLS
jgi:caffeoyl-CoA O-methyltransferase